MSRRPQDDINETRTKRQQSQQHEKPKQQKSNTTTKDTTTKNASTTASNTTNPLYDHPLLVPGVHKTCEQLTEATQENRSRARVIQESPYIQSILNQSGDDLHHDQSHHKQSRLNSNQTQDPAATINRLAGNGQRL